MIRCVSAFLLGLFVLPASSEFPPGSCDGYTNITESWRNLGFTSSSFAGFPNDDQRLVGSWWRFTGIGGDQVVSSCHSGPRGGTQHAIYLTFSHPTAESATPTTGAAHVHFSSCGGLSLTLSVVLCPGGFYVYNPVNHPSSSLGYVTHHSRCASGSCGPLAQCNSDGSCSCVPGYEIPTKHQPEPDSYGCSDIDECARTPGLCGPSSNCTNTAGSSTCSCLDGFKASDEESEPGPANVCSDIDECSRNVCGDDGTCHNNAGSYSCDCNKGFNITSDGTTLCRDIDECLNSSVCGPDSICTNTPGAFLCECEAGFTATESESDVSNSNVCIDVDECEGDSICGPNSTCTNSVGSYSCSCFSGFQVNDPDVIASINNTCTDIDECSRLPAVCGDPSVCTNAAGSFSCSCPDGFYPSTGILWVQDVSFCQSLQDILDAIDPPEGQSRERTFLSNMEQQLDNNTGVLLPEATVANSFSASMEVSGVGPRSRSGSRSGVSSDGDGETGTAILQISDRLIAAMTPATQNRTQTQIQTPTLDLSLHTIGPGRHDDSSVPLSTRGQRMDMDLQAVADNNNGSAAAAFLTLSGMENLLSHRYFQSHNTTKMLSHVFTVVLPGVKHRNLTVPVNFTITHREPVPDSGSVTCVYWEHKQKAADPGPDPGPDAGPGPGPDPGPEAELMRWSDEGCWVSFSDENVTVCSCSHLSTFALILQLGEPPADEPFLQWLNRVCVIVGLFFFVLSIVSFLLCSWNPKINNTARLHLCLCLSLTHLLLLWSHRYVKHQLACRVLAALLHFLVVSSFMWMQLEAVQMFLLVRRLLRVQLIHQEGLPRPLVYLLGYGTPTAIVAVSAASRPDGYGSTKQDLCWLSTHQHFNWALTGPVIFIITMNWILFCVTLWSLRPTVENMKSEVSQSRDTRLIVFKILAQFIILGCTWILGLYQTNLVLQVLFILLNSQQGTFLFIVHCLLNKEVRDEYMRWLTCSCGKDKTVEKDAASVSENVDKT